MSKEERNNILSYPFLKSYNVFNVAQTNLEDVNPKFMDKLKKKFNITPKEEIKTDITGMYVNEKIDEMLLHQNWICPIHYDTYSSTAFYQAHSDEITVPMKSQFKQGKTIDEIFEDGQEYYSTLLHEMIHSTGHKSRLDRNYENNNGLKNYGREELVAELGAALISNILGFSSRITDNNAAYLSAWVSQIKEQPKFIMSVLSDVNKASKMVLDIINVKKAELLKSA